MLHAGIQDSGIALKTMASLRDSGPSAGVAQSLLDIGCEPWFPNYIDFAGKYLRQESKAQMIMLAYCLLFRAAVRDPNKTDDAQDTLSQDSILVSTMMCRSVQAQALDDGA